MVSQDEKNKYETIRSMYNGLKITAIPKVSICTHKV